MIKVFSNIGTIIVSITAIVTLLSIVVKTSYNFLIESVKSKFKNVPEESSIFDVVTRFLYIVYVLTVVLLFILVIYALFISDDKEVSNSITKIYTTEYITQFLMIAIIFLPTIFNVAIFEIVRDVYVENIRKGYNNKFKNIIKRLNIGVLIIATIIFIVFLTITIYFLYKREDFNIIINLFFIVSLNFIAIIVALSINDASNNIESNYLYSFITSNGVITTKMYLEYKKYYLVIEDNVERFISKESIKEIVRRKDNNN